MKNESKDLYDRLNCVAIHLKQDLGVLVDGFIEKGITEAVGHYVLTCLNSELREQILQEMYCKAAFKNLTYNTSVSYDAFVKVLKEGHLPPFHNTTPQDTESNDK